MIQMVHKLKIEEKDWMYIYYISGNIILLKKLRNCGQMDVHAERWISYLTLAAALEIIFMIRLCQYYWVIVR